MLLLDQLQLPLWFWWRKPCYVCVYGYYSSSILIGVFSTTHGFIGLLMHTPPPPPPPPPPERVLWQLTPPFFFFFFFQLTVCSDIVLYLWHAVYIVRWRAICMQGYLTTIMNIMSKTLNPIASEPLLTMVEQGAMGCMLAAQRLWTVEAISIATTSILLEIGDGWSRRLSWSKLTPKLYNILL